MELTPDGWHGLGPCDHIAQRLGGTVSLTLTAWLPPVTTAHVRERRSGKQSSRVVVSDLAAVKNRGRQEVLQTSTLSQPRSRNTFVTACYGWRLAGPAAIWVQNESSQKHVREVASTETSDFVKEFWRRRPDLNRGWRFCRLSKKAMLLTRLAFWYLPDPRFTRCLGGFGPKLDPSLGGGFS